MDRHLNLTDLGLDELKRNLEGVAELSVRSRREAISSRVRSLGVGGRRDNAAPDPHNTGHEQPDEEADMQERLAEVERNVSDVKATLARIEVKVDNCVTKAQLASYAFLGVLGVLGAGWWVVQQYLSPILQSVGS